MNCQKEELPNVWLLQQPPIERDMSSAARYGVIRPILEANKRASILPGPCLNDIRLKLKDFKDGDYVFFAGGDSNVLLLAGIVLAEKGAKHVRLMRWQKGKDGEGGTYIPSEVRLNG